ncbi:MAG TPA: ribonuclease H family protein [Allocoleopsis sp.]
MAQQKYYAVARGRKAGIFTTWKDCERQVKGARGAVFKSFSTRAEAEAWLDQAGQEQKLVQRAIGQQSSASNGRESGHASQFITNSICVDAACSGNPGVVEYQGVCTESRDVIFHKKIAHGTNNLGEFLAIVHALGYLQNLDQQPDPLFNQDTPIYSDSATAMLWVKNKQIKTTLKRTAKTEEIFHLIDCAIAWLNTHEYHNPILKWDTQVWGEIPADFGRK